MRTLDTICADFNDWPSRWMGIYEDLAYGKELLEIFRPFAEQITSSGLSPKSLKKHIDNLWLLGGEIIRDVSMNEEYDVPPIVVLLKTVDVNGGPYCRHNQSEAEIKSFDKTCAELAKYLENKENS